MQKRDNTENRSDVGNFFVRESIKKTKGYMLPPQSHGSPVPRKKIHSFRSVFNDHLYSQRKLKLESDYF